LLTNFEEIFTSEIISYNLESISVFDEHYVNIKEAFIDIEGLEKIGWFKKRMELALKEMK